MTIFIIAECGVNHNGEIGTAKRLIDASLETGADAVKFQMWRKNRFPEIEHLRISKRGMFDLFAYAKNVGIKPFATAFDFESIDWLVDMQDIWKVPSGMVTNRDYLLKIASMEGKKILSIGMANFGETFDAVDFFSGELDSLTVMQCVTAYPVPVGDINLGVVGSLVSDQYWFDIGYSDHSGLPHIPPAAVALGAKMIEAHITLNKNAVGPDHKASLEPDEFKQMVSMCRDVELAMGDGVKKPTESEMKVRDIIREKMIDGC